MKDIKTYDIIKMRGNDITEVEDDVINEYPFTIYINDNEFITLLCSPKSLKYLAMGFLYSEGIISSKRDIKNIRIDNDKGLAYVYVDNNNILGQKLSGKRTVTTGCGKGTIFYNVMDSFKSKKIEGKTNIDVEVISGLINNFNKNSELFLKTGGVHSCALCNNDEFLYFEEDIGRHNALDKILGRALFDEIPLDDKIVLTSGRISSEIIIKIAKRGIPVVVSRSAPTSLAIEIARKLNITLIGFARGKKMNIYSNFPSLNS